MERQGETITMWSAAMGRTVVELTEDRTGGRSADVVYLVLNG